MKILTFDLEIRRLILQKGETPDPKYKYCSGWDDKENMGISMGCAYLNWERRYKFYDERNLQTMLEDFSRADLITGYNIWNFDTPLLKATLLRLGLPEETGMAGKCYDLCADIQMSNPEGRFAKGWKMGEVGKGTLGIGKDGDGAEAPKLWQEGRLAELVTYLTQDVKVNYGLMQYAMTHGALKNERGEVVQLKGIKRWQEYERTGILPEKKQSSKARSSKKSAASQGGFKFPPPQPPAQTGPANPPIGNGQGGPSKAVSEGAYSAPESADADLPFPGAGVQPQ